jgi:hypothetical protein
MINNLDITIVIKKLISNHSPSIKPNHLIIFIQNMKRISDVINQVKCVSQIADQDLSNPSCTAFSILCHKASSSLILANISIFESIAIPTESINQAIEASVRVIQAIFTKASINPV